MNKLLIFIASFIVSFLIDLSIHGLGEITLGIMTAVLGFVIFFSAIARGGV